MEPSSIPRSAATRKRIGLLAGAAAVALALTAAGAASAKLKLPAERTSPTGNYFTLEAYAPPTSSKPVANFEMKVCTSAHTPSHTAIAPALFTLTLAHGGSAPESSTAAKRPALIGQPLKKLQCVEGWLGFAVPKGATVSALEYAYNGKISWVVG